MLWTSKNTAYESLASMYSTGHFSVLSSFEPTGCKVVGLLNNIQIEIDRLAILIANFPDD